MTSPLTRYESDLATHKLVKDSAQRIAVEHLETLHQQLIEFTPLKPAWFNIIKYLSSHQKIQAPKGLYFWGGVGRGKTYLMDLFFHGLPFKDKMRVHFHRFMHRVHNELKQHAGQSDPLTHIATRLAKETRIICFDEFFVSDIADAMLLAGLIQALFKQGVVLVATSNIEPNELYKNGLQRARFVPVINLLETNCIVLNIDGGVDYRLRTLTQADIYHSPADPNADDNLRQYFQQLATALPKENTQITIENRLIPARLVADGVILFDFLALCDGPRSQTDYIEISRCYHSVLISQVQQMGADNDDIARRFIAMVDEFYERNVKLIMSADVELLNLYTQGKLNFEFKRCISRLQEMQSHEYLAKAHLA